VLDLSRSISLFALPILCASVASIPMFASAEESTTARESNALIEEIVVTARKRQEPLQDVPASAAALTADFIDDVGGVWNLRDITDLIVGISINETQEPTLTEVTIRGAGQSRNRASVSATGLYRNGAYFATNSLGGKNFARMDTYDLERVEVLRGPQGALYGRNALGGAMNLISKKPTDQLEFDFGLAAGELDMTRFDGKVNVPIGDKFAVRASYLTQDRDKGFYKDANGDYIDTQEFDHGRISLRFMPSEDWDINYVFDTQSEENAPSLRILDSRNPDIEDVFDTLINTPHLNEIDVDNHNLVADWTLGDGVLTSVSNYRERDLRITSDTSYLSGNINVATSLRETIQTVDNDIFFQELRYVADGGDNFQWLVGADYFTHDNTEIIDQWRGQLWNAAQFRTVNMSTDSWAIFGSAEYTFDSIPLSLTAELRYAEDKIDGDVLTYRRNVQTDPSNPDHDNPVNPQTDFATAGKDTNLPWGLTAAYRFDQPDLLTYFKIASSYRHGGMNLNEGTPDLDRYEAVLTYGEETAITYELGVKSTFFDRALTVNAAWYFTSYEDFLNTTTNGCPDQCQLTDEFGNGLGFNPDGSRPGEGADGEPIPPNEELPVAFFIDNVGKAEAWGWEIEGTYRAQWDFGGTLLFNLGYANGKGKVKSLNEDVSDATLAVADGAKLPYLRPHQVKGSVVYRQILGGLNTVPGFGGAALVVSTTYTYEEGGAGNLTNVPCCSTASWPQDTVKRLNANIGLETQNWSLFVRGDNLTDESYKSHDRYSWYMRNTPRYVFAEFMLHIRP
jgi:iron complex outermembrane receptor protein